MAFWNLRQFQTDLNIFSEREVPTEYKRRQIEIIIFLFRKIRERCPVAPDNSQWKGFKGGFALTNWRVSMNNPPNDTIGKYGNPTRLRTENEVRSQFDSMKQGSLVEKFGNKGAFDILWVFNNVHYIPALENGWSDQAPNGMVAIAIEETKLFIQSKGWDYPQTMKETRQAMFRYGFSAKEINSIFRGQN
jgi:hypothetical protein